MSRPVFKQGWFQLLCGGLVLFIALAQTLQFTGNPNYFPAVILVGAFLIPATFMSYFYGQERAFDRGLHNGNIFGAAISCFFIGGVTGILFAGVLEYSTLSTSSVSALLWVGFIEESAKLIFPLALFIRGRFKSEIDGLLFGVSSGMGFAALETMGYGLVSVIQTEGDVGALQQLLLVRGLVSPAGHAAWTGLVAAAIWRGRYHTGKKFTFGIVGYFLLAVVLHTSWNIISSVEDSAVILIGYLILGTVSVTLLIRRYREARSHAEASKVQPSHPPDNRG